MHLSRFSVTMLVASIAFCGAVMAGNNLAGPNTPDVPKGPPVMPIVPHATEPMSALLPTDVNHGPNPTASVVLSYDDCPKSLGAFKAMADQGKKLGVRLLFFPTGDCIASKRFDTNYALARGHYVGNHSISHPDFSKMSVSGIVRQLGSPGVQSVLARSPYGINTANTRAAYRQKGMTLVLWTLDTNDWKGYSESSLISKVVGGAKRQDMVLMHMQHKAFTTNALNKMVAGIRAKKLTVCRNTGPVSLRAATMAC